LSPVPSSLPLSRGWAHAPLVSRLRRAASGPTFAESAGGRGLCRAGASARRRSQVPLSAPRRACARRSIGGRHRGRPRVTSFRRRHVGTHVVPSSGRARVRPERIVGPPRGSTAEVAVSPSAGALARSGANRSTTFRATAGTGVSLPSVDPGPERSGDRRRRHHRCHIRGGGSRLAFGRCARGSITGGGRYARAESRPLKRLTTFTASDGSSSTNTPWMPTSIAADTFDCASSRKAVRWASTPNRARANR